ncbi:hypothetical protein BDR04DRAFT_1103455 [Suillus decipiens]|nr:hypothetical protein BDR04DRAFT_1103455 [Suillus decipiens]
MISLAVRFLARKIYPALIRAYSFSQELKAYSTLSGTSCTDHLLPLNRLKRELPK